jgi:hypothetical protein
MARSGPKEKSLPLAVNARSETPEQSFLPVRESNLRAHTPFSQRLPSQFDSENE